MAIVANGAKQRRALGFSPIRDRVFAAGFAPLKQIAEQYHPKAYARAVGRAKERYFLYVKKQADLKKAWTVLACHEFVAGQMRGMVVQPKMARCWIAFSIGKVKIYRVCRYIVCPHC